MVTGETNQHLMAFEVWYQCHRSARKCAGECGVSEDTVSRWAAKFGWHERADARDAEAFRLSEAAAIRKQAALFRKLTDVADSLLEHGIRFLDENGVRDERSAIMAIREAATIARVAQGIPSWIGTVMRESDEDLVRHYLESRSKVDDEHFATACEAAAPDDEEGWVR